jgi:ketosteroid isomerase-like protein
MTAVSSKQALAEVFLTALRTQDWDLMRTIMTQDLVWSLPGTSRISGEACGVEAVIVRCKVITSYGLDFALKHVLYGQHGFTLSLNNTARRGDSFLDEHLATVCSLQGGQINRIDTYLSDVAMADAFFR